MGSNPTLSAIEVELAACVAAGRFEALAPAYAPAATLEAHLAGDDVVRHGPDAITAELTALYGGEPSPVTRPPGLFGPDWQRAGADGEPVRHTHWLHRSADDGRIERHVVFPGRPLVGDATTGQAGSWLERVGDGRIVKHLSPAWDWIMRATQDTGREATLWRDGPLQFLPDGVVDPVVDVWPEDGGWAIAMRDVTPHLLAVAPLALSETDLRRVVEAAAAVHRHCDPTGIDGLCTLEDRLLLLSPRTAARERDGVDYIPKQVRRGWQLFPSLVPADVADAIAAIHADPRPLATAIRDAGRPALLHGDLNLRNVGLTDDAVVLVDWALAADAPGEVDFAFLLTSWALTGTSREGLEAMCRNASGDRWSERAWDLALLGQLAWEGQFLSVLAVDHPDPYLRGHFLAELTWWADRISRSARRRG